jgi:putative ABC transport system permease protein
MGAIPAPARVPKAKDATAIVTSSKTYTFIIGSIGLAILIVAGVNYINLTTAKSLKSAKEVGIRKVLGASVSGLIVLLAQNFVRLVLIATSMASRCLSVRVPENELVTVELEAAPAKKKEVE